MPLYPLPTVAHSDLRAYGSAARPLRPSKVAQFLRCPMSLALTFDDSNIGNRAAQTGNIVHDMAEAFHKHSGTLQERMEAGRQALAAAQEAFPDGDPVKARKHYDAYVVDPENQEAVVDWCEAAVTLTLPADASDPTGEPIVINGTLDQVRRTGSDSGVKRRVWDIKTGDSKKLDEYLIEYLIQQAVYTLAARQTLDPNIEPGGLIWTPGYFSSRSRTIVPLPLTVETCTILVAPVPLFVAAIRRGERIFVPSADTCKFCPVRPWPHCVELYNSLYGVHK